MCVCYHQSAPHRSLANLTSCAGTRTTPPTSHIQPSPALGRPAAGCVVYSVMQADADW